MVTQLARVRKVWAGGCADPGWFPVAEVSMYKLVCIGFMVFEVKQWAHFKCLIRFKYEIIYRLS